MRNPCNNCKTKWLCHPYGGMCWLKKRYIKRISTIISSYAVKRLQEYCDEIIEKGRVTHWMPLPEPPKEEEQNG